MGEAGWVGEEGKQKIVASCDGPLAPPQATDPLQTQQVLEEAKLRMKEEMERRTNAKEADAAMDQEKIR